MTGTTTGQTSLSTATDSDDTENFLTVVLTATLQALANLFDSGSGHDHSGAGKGKPIAAAGLANNSVATANLQANAATQSLQSNVATGSTASTTMVDTGLSVTITTVGGNVRIEGTLCSANSAAGNVLSLSIMRDGATLVNVAQVTSPGVSYQKQTPFCWLDVAPAAGSHTYKLQYAVSAGTETLNTVYYSVMVVTELKR